MNYILLLGAGFSRNWGGWLASEAFEYLLGSSEIDDHVRNILWQNKNKGFEEALAKLQAPMQSGKTNPSLVKLQSAIIKMFSDMDAGFVNVSFENREQPKDQTVAKFLSRFDAIYTLNQDLLLERRYLSKSISEYNEKWSDYQMPGMVRGQGFKEGKHTGPHIGKWYVRRDCNIEILPNLQPYIKIHGSSNWFTGDSEELLVMGANKMETINRYPILKWNYDHFANSLTQAKSKLMVIGYGFRDDHINRVIRAASISKNVDIFVIDPLGVDVIDENRDQRGGIYAEGKEAKDIWPCVIGASRRTLGEIFGRDKVEYGKVMRFFD